MSRHAACHGMNTKADLFALALQDLAKLLYLELGLGKCHTITRNNHDFLGRTELAG